MNIHEFINNVEVDETDIPQILITSSKVNGVKIHSTLNVENQKKLLLAICENMGLFENDSYEHEFDEKEIVDDFNLNTNKQTENGYSVIGEGSDMNLLRTDKILTGSIIDPIKG